LAKGLADFFVDIPLECVIYNYYFFTLLRCV
jgi:hypothetical protein